MSQCVYLRLDLKVRYSILEKEERNKLGTLGRKYCC